MDNVFSMGQLPVGEWSAQGQSYIFETSFITYVKCETLLAGCRPTSVVANSTQLSSSPIKDDGVNLSGHRNSGIGISAGVIHP